MANFMGGTICRIHALINVVVRRIRLCATGGVRWKGCCMLAPPNGGSCVARRFRNLHFPISTVFGRIYGKAGEHTAVLGLSSPCLGHAFHFGNGGQQLLLLWRLSHHLCGIPLWLQILIE